MIIGITGCIGSGKTYITNLIHDLYGFDTFSADKIAKDSYNDENISKKLDEKFNCLVNGKIDVSILKAKLNKNTINDLNLIIHPYVIDRINSIKKQYNNSIAIVEVPLLFESNLAYLFDKTITISTKKSLRHKRILNRDVTNYKTMLKLEKQQLTNFKKVKLADFVIKSGINDKKNLNNTKNVINKIMEEYGL